MEILEALKQLDTAKDEHWTGDGLPKVDIVAQIAGAEIKRADIVNAAPEFNRASADTEDEQPEDKVAMSHYDSLVEQRIGLEEQLVEISQAITQLGHERDALESKIHACGIMEGKFRPVTQTQNDIQRYLASQRQVALDKAKQRKTLQESGIGEVLKNVGKAPIDAAMNQRKPARGTQRPVRNG